MAKEEYKSSVDIARESFKVFMLSEKSTVSFAFIFSDNFSFGVWQAIRPKLIKNTKSRFFVPMIFILSDELLLGKLIQYEEL